VKYEIHGGVHGVIVQQHDNNQTWTPVYGKRRGFHLARLSWGKFHPTAVIHHWGMMTPVLNLTPHLPSLKCYHELQSGWWHSWAQYCHQKDTPLDTNCF